MVCLLWPFWLIYAACCPNFHSRHDVPVDRDDPSSDEGFVRDQELEYHPALKDGSMSYGRIMTNRSSRNTGKFTKNRISEASRGVRSMNPRSSRRGLSASHHHHHHHHHIGSLWTKKHSNPEDGITFTHESFSVRPPLMPLPPLYRVASQDSGVAITSNADASAVLVDTTASRSISKLHSTAKCACRGDLWRHEFDKNGKPFVKLGG
ncbi:hypothetical protein FKW77_010525 [Venturia effusa]|uniref:Uncharacterized protein n=1 Tax=Venturia effusa TaxID=50376 RepID=A0A517L2H6_9PEZI|nr:hypothetical protein FKW77_010525 [Venturia effusa]